MPVPKKRHSKGRTRRKRYEQYVKRDVVNTVVCKKCKAAKLPHVICAECGSK